MNPRQRRGLLYLLASGLLGITAFGLVAGYVSDVESKVGETVMVVQVAERVDAYTQIEESDLELVEVPARWAPETVLRDLDDAVGQVPTAPLNVGSYLQREMLSSALDFSNGQRQLTLELPPDRAGGGRVTRGSFVDVVAAYPAGSDGTGPGAVTIVQSVQVIDIGEVERKEGTDGEGNFESNTVVPVYLALEPTEANAVIDAQANADSIWLLLRAPGDLAQVAEPDEVELAESEAGAQGTGGSGAPPSIPAGRGATTGAGGGS